MSKNVKMTNPMKVITGPNTRWSYANVWEPKSINGGTPKYSVSLIIPKSDTTTIDSIDENLMALQQELIQKANSKEDYDEIADEIFRLRELRQKTTVDTAARDEQIKRINDLQGYISQQTALLTEFDEALVRRWIKQITIWDDRITVELKSGVSINVDA